MPPAVDAYTDVLLQPWPGAAVASYHHQLRLLHNVSADAAVVNVADILVVDTWTAAVAGHIVVPVVHQQPNWVAAGASYTRPFAERHYVDVVAAAAAAADDVAAGYVGAGYRAVSDSSCCRSCSSKYVTLLLLYYYYCLQKGKITSSLFCLSPLPTAYPSFIFLFCSADHHQILRGPPEEVLRGF